MPAVAALMLGACSSASQMNLEAPARLDAAAGPGMPGTQRTRQSDALLYVTNLLIDRDDLLISEREEGRSNRRS